MIISQIACPIPAGATGLSGPIDLNDARLSIIYVPAGWVAANITLQSSFNGTDFFNVFNEVGTEYTITAAASRAILVPLADLLGARHIKLRSGTNAAPVNQTGAPTLSLVLVP